MKRYPLAPLLDAMGMSANQACLALGLSGSTQQQYRRDGVTERVADRLAGKAGFSVYEIWPEMADDVIDAVAAADRARENAGERRRYRTDPAKRARRLETRRAYYAQHGEYERAAQRVRDAARYAANRDEINARRRERRRMAREAS